MKTITFYRENNKFDDLLNDTVLKKHLSKLRKEGNRNFFDDVFHQGGIRGKTGKTEEPTGDMGWGETLTQAASNVPHSAYQTFVEPIVNYEQTLEGLKQLGKGAYSKAAGVFVDQDGHYFASFTAAGG